MIRASRPYGNGSELTTTPTVAAVIVTFNDLSTLQRCLETIRAQAAPPTHVIVVDNASKPPITTDDVGDSTVLVTALFNGGPAGGFAIGLEHFLRLEADYAWVMDDDCEPEPGSLALLMSEANQKSVLIPLLDVQGKCVHRPSWCGVVIPRQVVLDVGVPRSDFVWWGEDTEYLQWRIPRAGFRVRHSAAHVVTTVPRRSLTKPCWKYYYEARNSVYLRLRLKRSNVVRGLYRVLVKRSLGVIRAQWRRPRCIALHFRGIADGLAGRLGMRVPLRET